ncbi:MAG: trigger factor, partial [Alphaproteobacteria bacterium]|nr:trigger factor [Alphaproteobacteria bacterium]
KVPMNVLRKRFGPSVLGEVVEAAVRDTSSELVQDRGLRPASQPKVEMTAFAEGKDLEFALAFEVLPQIEQPDLKAIKLVRMKVNPADKEVDEALARLAKENGGSEAVAEDRPAAQGDIVVVDFIGRIDGEAFEGGTATDLSIELGAGGFVPGFEDQLVGHRAGAKVDVTVTFPEDYGTANLAGKTAVFESTIKELRASKPAAVDDELAKKIGFDDLAALREAIRGRIQHDYDGLTRDRMKRELLDKLADTASFKVPDSLLDQEFAEIWRQVEHAKEHNHLDADDVGKDDERLKSQYRTIAERRVRLGLLLSDIGQKNGIQVAQEEVNRAIMEEARRMPGHERRVIEFYREHPEMQERLKAPIFEDKVVDFVIALAEVDERESTLEEMIAAAGAAEAGHDHHHRHDHPSS